MEQCPDCHAELKRVSSQTLSRRESYSCPSCRCAYEMMYPEDASGAVHLAKTYDPFWFEEGLGTDG